MEKKKAFLFSAIAIGLTGLGFAYYFLVWNKASEDQFMEFLSNVKKNGFDTLDVDISRQNALLLMWKKNLTRKQANRLIYLSSKQASKLSVGETLEFSRLVSDWFERPVKA